jgi:hypothetical protein
MPTTTTRRPSARAVLTAAKALIERAEQRAKTCGGEPHENVTKPTLEALRGALQGEPPAQP